MHVLKSSVVIVCFGCATLAAIAQNRKPGLYDVTLSTTTVTPTPEAHSPRTWQACLTPEMIDKYGAIVPENLTNMCQLVNVVKNPGGMSANLVCSGFINGKGTLAVNWSDSEHSKGNIHFSGTMRPGDNDIKIEWSATTTSVYKGPDCSAVTPPAPAAPPPSKP